MTKSVENNKVSSYNMKRTMEYYEMMKERDDEFLMMNCIEFFEEIKDHFEEEIEHKGNDCVEYGLLGSLYFLIDLIYRDKDKYEKVKEENKMIMEMD